MKPETRLARLRRALAGLVFVAAGLLDEVYAVPDIPELVSDASAAERFRLRALDAERRLDYVRATVARQRTRLEGLAHQERFSEHASARTVAWAAVREVLDDIVGATR